MFQLLLTALPASVPSILSGVVASDVPVDPDSDQAAQWIIDELAKPQYQAAQPTLFDIVSQAFWNWLTSLDPSGATVPQAPFLAVLVVVIAGALLAAFLIFGVPRLNRRSTASRALFGADDGRTAEQLRRSAQDAASEQDWSLAIEELFRSIAQLMAERVLVATSPGTTAREFSQRAGGVFPAFAERLDDSSVAFDRVRYLGHPGSAADYERLAVLESELRSARAPAIHDPHAQDPHSQDPLPTGAPAR